MENVYLAHYGVKGMRWGVRKKETRTGSHRTDRELRRDVDAVRKRTKRLLTVRNVMAGAAIVGGIALATYGSKRYAEFINDTNYEFHATRAKSLIRLYRDKTLVRNLNRRNSVFGKTNINKKAAIAVIDHDNAVFRRTVYKLFNGEMVKTKTDTFRQAVKNANAYRYMMRHGGDPTDNMTRLLRSKYNTHNVSGKISYLDRYSRLR